MIAPLTQEGPPTPMPRRRWLPRCGLAVPEVTARDIAYIAGCALVCFGGLPLVELSARRDLSVDAEAAPLTHLDLSVVGVSALLVLLGAAMVVVQWFRLPVPTLQRLVALMFVGIVLVMAVALGVLIAITRFVPVETPTWITEASVQDEPSDFEWKINDVYCHANGANVCRMGNLAAAQEAFPLQHWPRPGPHQRQAVHQIEGLCQNYDDSTRQWGQPPELQICGLCRAIEAETKDTEGEELLRLLGPLNSRDRRWCGEYLVNHRTDLDGPSPFEEHQATIRDLLHPLLRPCELRLAVAALKVLLMWAALAGGALFQWSSQLAYSVALVDVAVKV